MSICESLAKEAKVLDLLGKVHNREFALCIKNGDTIFVRGGRRSVKVNQQCNVILHNHPTSQHFSEADLRESEKTIVCMVHGNVIKCVKDRKMICESTLNEEAPSLKLSFSHHEAEFNLLEIAKQLALLEEHYAREEIRCADCMVKHLLLIQGYAEEALRLDHGEKYRDLIEEIISFIEDQKKTLEKGVLTESDISKTRELRKKIFEELNILSLDEEWHGLKVKYDQWNWEALKPRLPSQRWEAYEKHGAKCFLRPQDLGFPICNIHGELDCDGLRAAYVRAKSSASGARKANREDLAREYESIASQALSIAKEVGCKWVKEGVEEYPNTYTTTV